MRTFSLGPLQVGWSLDRISMTQRVQIFMAASSGEIADAMVSTMAAGMAPEQASRLFGPHSADHRKERLLAYAHENKLLNVVFTVGKEYLGEVIAWCHEGFGPLDRANQETTSSPS